MLENEDVSLYQRLKEQAEAIQGHVFCKRIVAWLEREWKLQLYDETKRKLYLQSLEDSTFTDAMGKMQREISTGKSKAHKKVNSKLVG